MTVGRERKRLEEVKRPLIDMTKQKLQRRYDSWEGKKKAPSFRGCPPCSKHLPHPPLLVFFFCCCCRLQCFVSLDTTLGCTWGCAVGSQRWGPEKHYCLPAASHTAAGSTDFLGLLISLSLSLPFCLFAFFSATRIFAHKKYQ